MRKIIIKIIVLIIYIILMLWLVDFKLLTLFDIKLVTIFVFGTIILTLSSFKKNGQIEEIIIKIRWNAQLTAYLSTIMLQLAYFSSDYVQETMLYDIAMNFRPLIYSLLVLLVIGDAHKKPKLIDETTINEQFSDYNLSRRERMVAEKILEDLTNKEIGVSLFISENTVKKHIQNILHKTNTNNREEFKKLFR